MDIEFLLWLQGIRETLGPAVEAFMNAITLLGSSVPTTVIACTIYWVVSKELGLFIFTNFGIGNNINQTIKDTACVYRPWVRDARIHPSVAALGHATGYSFPSGHTQGAGSLYGSIAWKNREKKPLAALLLFLVLLIGFSRTYLGVHTPQDVIVAIAEAALTIWLSERFIAWVRRDTTKDTTVLAVGFAVLAAIVLYTVLKPYPMDYVDGQLLVDPAKMKLDAYSNAGLLGGVLLGWFLEHRYVRFSTDVSLKRKVVRFIVCVATVGVFYGITLLIKASLGSGVEYATARGLFTAFSAVFAGPAIATFFENLIDRTGSDSPRESE